MTRSKPVRSGVKLIWTTLVLLIASMDSYSLTANGQAPAAESPTHYTELTEVEVPVIHTIDSGRPGFGYCGSYSRSFGPVVTEEEFREILAPSPGKLASFDRDRCTFLNRLKVDFSRHTLLTYRVNGDCFVRATAQVVRNDTSRRYLLRVTKRYGGCRAAGGFEAWLVIEKIRSDYEVEVELFVRDESGGTMLDQR